MKKFKILLIFAVILCVTAGVGFSSEKGSSHGSKKVSNTHELADSAKKDIKKTMQKFIDKELCSKGSCKLGDVKAEFDYLHDEVKEKNGYFISCADFKVGNSIYDVDIFVTSDGIKSKVDKATIHKVDGKKVNKVIWSAKDKKGSDKGHKGSSHGEKGSGKKNKGSGHKHKGSSHDH